MTKYRKNPVVIEAFKWTGDVNQTEDPEWIAEAVEKGEVWFINSGTEQVVMQIDTLEGIMTANRGDFIIKGIKNEIYPCKPDIFEATYESSGLYAHVSLVDTDVFKNILDKSSDLIIQIVKGKFEHGHRLDMNQAYFDFLESLGIDVASLYENQ